MPWPPHLKAECIMRPLIQCCAHLCCTALRAAGEVSSAPSATPMASSAMRAPVGRYVECSMAAQLRCATLSVAKSAIGNSRGSGARQAAASRHAVPPRMQAARPAARRVRKPGLRGRSAHRNSGRATKNWTCGGDDSSIVGWQTNCLVCQAITASQSSRRHDTADQYSASTY